MLKKLLIVSLLVFPVLVFAQVAVDPNQEFLDLLIKSLGGVKGLSTLGIVALVVQLLMKLMNTTWFNSLIPVKVLSWKLPAVTLLSLVSGVLALVHRDNLSWSAALLHSTTLSAAMVFAHQWIQWFKPDSTTPKVG